ncbi:hypothetical protein SAMN05216390_102344 [Lachnospiraceae bacterium KH1T2]|nr:hypothetical protein SAMN05216390_102344 [Lachnospiraceae bacterium KH1T2]
MPMPVKLNLSNKDNIKRFININMNTNCEIDVVNGRISIDGKSIVGLMSLDLMKPVDVFIIGDSDEINEVKSLYEKNNLTC